MVMTTTVFVSVTVTNVVGVFAQHHIRRPGLGCIGAGIGVFRLVYFDFGFHRTDGRKIKVFRVGQNVNEKKKMQRRLCITRDFDKSENDKLYNLRDQI